MQKELRARAQAAGTQRNRAQKENAVCKNPTQRHRRE
jgi:hypothetical protein